MARIRSAAKAVITDGERILLQRCKMSDGAVYYELPGGGQHPMETMEEAVLRECLEETGYTVRIVRPLALLEEILVSDALVAQYPGYAHRIFHVFLCECTDAPRVEPSEEDIQQEGMDWLTLDEVEKVILRPAAIQPALRKLLASDEMAYLGSRRIDNIV